jgi:hypothetical protein
MKKHKCPCGINCISYAICKHKTFDGLLHECSEVYDFLHPTDLMDNNRCRILDKSLQSTEWEVKILGGKNVYEVVRERYRNPRRPGRTLEKQWVWLRIIDIHYDVNLKEARIFDEC